MYSKYDQAKKEYVRRRNFEITVRAVASFVSLFILSMVLNIHFTITRNVLYGAVVFFALYFVADVVLRIVWPSYNLKRKEEKELCCLMDGLKKKMRSFISSIEKRGKGRQFKTAYDLTGKSIEEFEKILGIAMCHEKKEVWTTAFCRQGIVVRVTATIGSERRCRPSDSVTMWKIHINKLGCDELRQYHNHPAYKNHASPSIQYIRTSSDIKKVLVDKKDMLRTYIIFWNEIFECRVLEYFDSGKTKIAGYFDVAA